MEVVETIEVVTPNIKRTTRLYYGAAERVKQQLDYRLGATMIKHSRSFKGKVTLIPSLWKEYKQYQSEQSDNLMDTLPPITEYLDANEIHKVQRHLSYRLGVVFLKNIKNPIGWLKLPFAIANETYLFRQSLKQSFKQIEAD